MTEFSTPEEGATQPQAPNPETTESSAPETPAPELAASELADPESIAPEPSSSQAPASGAAPQAPIPDDPSFSDLGLPAPLLRVLDEVGYENPSPIQAGAIPPLLAGRDVLGQAQTGTGKTAAFALPLVARLDLNGPPGAPRVLVLTPTRELAIQVAEAFQRYASGLRGFRVLPVYGGQAYDRQFHQLRRGMHVVVGTPGRVMDHMRRGTLDLGKLDALVLDEADEMLRMGFREDVEWVLEQTPPERQIALFSATLPRDIRRIAGRHMRDPQEICVEKMSAPASTIRQRFWVTRGEHKLDALTRMLEVEPFDGMIVFVRTKNATLTLAEKLGARGFSAAPMNGDMVQAMREKTVQRMESGQLDILVATDVAARGLDLERISHVVNYDVPYDVDSYVHRVGRTGRAGRQGEAILFVAPRERRILQAIERVTGTRFERMEMPSVSAVNDSRVARFEKQLTETLEAEEWGEFHALLERFQARHDVPGLEIAAALAVMLQGDRPFLMKEPPKPERPPRGGRGEESLERYRVAVGRVHGVAVGDLVGAIAGETGLEGRRIGRIEIHHDHSFVDLPPGMPMRVQEHLRDTRVKGQPLKIVPARGQREPRHSGPRHGGPRHGGPRHGGPRHDGPRHGGPRHGGPRHDGPRHGGPRHGGPRHDGPRHGGPRHDGPRHDGPRHDGPPRHDGGPRHSGGSRHDGPGRPFPGRGGRPGDAERPRGAGPRRRPGGPGPERPGPPRERGFEPGMGPRRASPPKQTPPRSEGAMPVSGDGPRPEGAPDGTPTGKRVGKKARWSKARKKAAKKNRR